MAVSYVYEAQAKASFKTAYLQRAIPLEVVPGASVVGHVGDVFAIGASSALSLIGASSVYASSSAGYADAQASAAKALVSAGQYIIAQGDMTMGYGHVPVENRDYRYSDAVNFESGVAKKLMAYPIYEVQDLVLDADVNMTVTGE